MGQALPDMALMGSCILILAACTIKGVFGDEVKSVKEGDTVTLNSDVTKDQHDRMQWYFNETRIALINGDPSTSCFYDGPDGRFRDRLEVDYKSGSLIIRNITTQHTGRYEAAIYRSKISGKSESLNRPSKCNSTKINNKTSILGDIIKSINLTVNGSALSPTVPGSALSPSVPGSALSPTVVAGIVVGVLLLLAVVVVVVGVLLLLAVVVVVVGVMIFRRRSSSDDKKKNKQGLELVSMDKKQNEEKLMI